MTDYKLVPFPPTREMVEAAEDAYMPFGDMELAIRMALLAAPAVQGELLGYVVPRMAARLGKGELCGISVLDQPEDGHTLPVYLTPQPEEQQPAPDVEVLVDALEELIDLMEDTRQGEYIPDSFTTQPARIALATYRKGAKS